MFQMFRRYKDNPGPSSEPPTLDDAEPFVGMHASIWKFLTHLDKRQAITDERVLFVMRWMLPTVLAVEFLILGYLIGA